MADPPLRSLSKIARRRTTRLVGASIVVATLAAVAGGTPERLEVGRFSDRTVEQGLPEEWQPVAFRRIERTRYDLVRDGGTTVVRATSEDAASGLGRAVAIDPAVHGILEWRWKVARPLARGDVTKKSGDDYAARIYVAFDGDRSRLSIFERAVHAALELWYGRALPVAGLSYVWDGRAPVGTIVPNPYTDRVRMIVVESGEAKAGRWVEERRDVAADFRTAFGEEPPPITAVAIMTDTDDTGESATAWYGDVAFVRAGASSAPASRGRSVRAGERPRPGELGGRAASVGWSRRLRRAAVGLLRRREVGSFERSHAVGTTALVEPGSDTIRAQQQARLGRPAARARPRARECRRSGDPRRGRRRSGGDGDRHVPRDASAGSRRVTGAGGGRASDEPARDQLGFGPRSSASACASS